MNYDDTANYLLERISATGHPIPKVAVVLGSGLGKLGEMIENPLTDITENLKMVLSNYGKDDDRLRPYEARMYMI